MLPLSHLTSCTPTKSNLYPANSLAVAVSESVLYRLLTFHVPPKMSLFLLRDTSSKNTPPGVFGPKWDEATGEWRKLHEEELRDFYSLPNIVWVVKSRIIR